MSSSSAMDLAAMPKLNVSCTYIFLITLALIHGLEKSSEKRLAAKTWPSTGLPSRTFGVEE
jgi:hypothetical protein